LVIGKDAKSGGMESNSFRGRAIEWIATLFLVALLAWGAKAFTRVDTAISTIWLSNGFLLGVILTADRQRRPALLIAGALGNYLIGGPIDGWYAGAVNTLFNLLEVHLASFRQRRIAEAQDLTNPQTFRRFLWFAVLLAPAVSGSCHALYVFATEGKASLPVSVGSMISHALGIATFTPVTMALRRDRIVRNEARGRALELLLTLALVAGVTLIVFSQNRFPLLFLVFPAMLLMAMRGGFGGTAVAVVLVVIIAVGFTVAGYGPLNLGRSGPAYQYFFLLQVFNASLLLTMFPVVVVLAERRRALQSVRDSALQLKLLTDHSTDVIVLTDVAGRRLYASPGVKEVFGFTPEEFCGMTWHDLIHAEDRERIRVELAEQSKTSQRSTVTYRALRADGREIWVEALVCTFDDEDFQRLGSSLADTQKIDGGVHGRQGRVVTLRDVTRRRRAEEALAEANLELASLVWKDALTGLANRRRFDEAITEEWGRCARAGQPLSVIMLDVDHFKAFNDEHGHQQGDHRLIEVAGAIAEALFRPRDLAVRYGGEEFAVVLPATGIDEAGLVAERIRENVMSLDGRAGSRGFGLVTVSLGVAGAVPLPHGKPGDIVKAADDALYTSKREGRNRTTLLQVNWPGLDLDETNF
jgi:diguanylate cyclase (GGDEF)-like protein/PAS domain S-box-containing protein